MESIIKKANILVEAIPYIHEFRQKVFVIKYGGSILDNTVIRKQVLEDIVFLNYVGIRVVLVHGGGPHISTRLKEGNLKSEFHQGIRVTDGATLSIVREELEKLNAKIVQEIKTLKGDVVGVKGNEDLIYAEKKKASKDLGFVGSVIGINKESFNDHLNKGYIMALSPMGTDKKGQNYNINADEVASAVAKFLEAEKLVLLTNVPGVMRDPENPDSLISTLTVDGIDNLAADNVIQSGMIPKVNACVDALYGGVHKTHIVDARLQHALLLEFFTDQGVGTQIIKE